MPPTTPSIDTLLSHFTSSLHLHPRPTWLTQTLSSQRQLPTGPALLASLKFRILASDITESLQPHANLCFPPTTHDGDVISVTLPGPIAVQVVAVEDVGVSRVEQIDKIEMAERGEIQRGREVIRVVPEIDGVETQVEGGGVGQGEQKVKTGPCKVLLEDAGGRRVYGIELKPVEGIKSDMAIGAKLVLRHVVVTRGLLLLTPATTTFLGGKIEVMNQAWLASRKQTLQTAIEALKPQ
ncbi:hypothetical protein Q9L58_009185 [Maublancomyces gigas]|uniref:RecQ-mediated genome instability protein 1 n=1 Tax=Discina gigas TaxID=1032678 RepID=A0ABR3G8M5_9PEZI